MQSLRQLSVLASIVATACLILNARATAEEPAAAGANPAPVDTRQLVSMPEEAQQRLRKDMLDHLMVLDQILGHLAASEFRQASELAESRLGRSSMGRHRGTGMGPGRFMPPPMHQLGMSMHQAASDFAVTARDGDGAEAYSALRRVTSFCVACHASFRIR